MSFSASQNTLRWNVFHGEGCEDDDLPEKGNGLTERLTVNLATMQLAGFIEPIPAQQPRQDAAY